MPGSYNENDSFNLFKDVLSICCLNVHGGLENKLENSDFVQGLMNKDIIFSIRNLDKYKK